MVTIHLMALGAFVKNMIHEHPKLITNDVFQLNK